VEPWTKVLPGLLNLFLKSNCALCQRPTPDSLCPHCQRKLQRCQLSSSDRVFPGSPPLLAWGSYSNTLKQVLAALKYNHQPHLAQPLGHWLGQAWLQSPLASAIAPSSSRRLCPTVVPIPLHKTRQQQRGYNQAELLAQSFCQIARLPLQRQGLERIRATEAQFGLSPAARTQNLANAFRLSKKLQQHPPTTVILLDDIYTTGATVNAAVQMLQKKGIEVYSIVAVAKAMRQ